ncbi:cilia- and flagella-associated protein 107 [Ascaphus truei]|uniref:cilia- and flagella-associated protein 107 n=1 Tax=Ascaphus truei TaxID=8439 RepID=UPI003F59B72F
MSEYSDSFKKWSLSGWKIEQKYSNKVLIGNWLEERKKFKRSCLPKPKSCYDIDFVSYPDSKPDQILRRSFMKRMEGLPSQHLLSHHGEPKSKHLVSLYDDHFLRHGNSSLPPLRSWDGRCLAWIPERSDYPIEDPPTNFGLLQKKKKIWRENFSEEDLKSIYTASYKHPPACAFTTARSALAPRILSCSKKLNKR